jgi:hypothetical protein
MSVVVAVDCLDVIDLRHLSARMAWRERERCHHRSMAEAERKFYRCGRALRREGVQPRHIRRAVLFEQGNQFASSELPLPVAKAVVRL